jgi:hypothetical protein
MKTMITFLVLILTSLSFAGKYDLTKIPANRTLDIVTGEQFLETALFYTPDGKATSLPTRSDLVASFLNQHMPLQTAVAVLAPSELLNHGLKKQGWVIESVGKGTIDWVQLASDIDLALNPSPKPDSNCPVAITATPPFAPIRRIPGVIPIIP